MKFCLDSLDLLWMINSMSYLAKKNIMRNACKVKKLKKENATPVASVAKTLKSRSINCSTVHV